MKKTVLSRLLPLLLACLLCTALLSGCLFTRNWQVKLGDIQIGGPLSGGTVSHAGEADSAAVRDISVSWAAGSVLIQAGDTDRIAFEEYPQTDDPMIWKVDGDELMIHFSDRKITDFTEVMTQKDLIITVPRQWVGEEIQVDTAAADLTADALTADEMELNSASAVCRFTDCSFDTLEINTASGDISFAGALTELECNAVSADCVCSFSASPRKIDLNSVSGDMTLYLPESGGFRAELETLSGHFDTDFICTGSEDKYRCGDETCFIEVNALSGNVRILKFQG